MSSLYPEFFNDVFGPVMQPGSSSHTAGPCRLAYTARCLLGEKPAKAEFILDPEGSFAGTFGHMNEDGGMLGGAMGLLPDHPDVLDARARAHREGLTYDFLFQEMKESDHINALKIRMTGISGKIAVLVGDSTGGGMIETKRIQGFPLKLKGDTHVVLVFDPLSHLSRPQLSKLEKLLKGLISTHRVDEEGLGKLYYFKVYELQDLEEIRKITATCRVEFLQAVLPVLTIPRKKEQLFDSMTKWRQVAQDRGLSFYETALQYEADASGWSTDKITDYMKMIERKLYRQTHAVYEEQIPLPSNSFNHYYHIRWEQFVKEGKGHSGGVTSEAVKLALAVNAKIPGVEMVPGPMGTGGGYLYSALYSVKQAKGYSDQDLLRGLFIAAGVGAIAYTRTYPTGEYIGCAGECGVCCAMAAAAITEMAGGTPEQVEHAASFAVQLFIGSPCDPIPGGFEQPCLSRFITATCMAIHFSDLALAGCSAFLPFHEALDAADLVGRNLHPDLKCTSRGGCCAVPSAIRQKEFFDRQMKTKSSQSNPL